MKKYKLCDTTALLNNKLILMFSGGFDSTSILINLLEEGHRNIKCIYIDIPNNNEKSKIEQKRCKKILKAVGKLFGVRLKLKVYTSMEIPDDNSVTFTQLFLHVTTIAPIIKDNDYVLFGYHRGSSVWNCYERLEESFVNMNCILRCTRRNQLQHNPGIFSPLEWMDKWQIIRYLKQYKKIYRLCWTCEGSFNIKSEKPCGKCIPCRNLKRALKELKHHNK